MLIKALTLENFKGVRDQVRIEFKPITLLFGPNSAGKSTILQAFVYAREILERHNLDPDRTLLGGEWMDLGGFETLVYGHDKKRKITLGFELDLQAKGLPTFLHQQELHELETTTDAPSLEDYLSNIDTATVLLTLRWSELIERPFVESTEIHANATRLIRIESTADGKTASVSFFDHFHPMFSRDEVETITSPWFSQLIETALRDEYVLLRPEFQSFIEEEKARRGVSESKSESKGPIAETGFQLSPAFIAALGGYEGPRYFVGNLELGQQADALPRVGEPLKIDAAAWREWEGWQDWEVRQGWLEEYTVYWYQRFIEAMLSSVTVGCLTRLLGELQNLLYIGPLREVPSRHPSYMRVPDTSRWARGSAAWDVLHNAQDDFLAAVNDWLAEENRLHTGYWVQLNRFRELPADHPITFAILQGHVLDEEQLAEELRSLPLKTRITLHDTMTDLEVLPQDIGVGVSQILPVVVAALHQKSGILAIEQPELHIHPAIQVALGDLFAAQLPNTDVLYLLETHSEHLMLRLLRRIRETNECELAPGAPELRPQDVAVNYVENTMTGIKITPLRIDEDGEFQDRWPAGFFAERMQELM